MKRRNGDNLPFLQWRQPPPQLEPRFLGWVLCSLLAVVGVSFLATMCFTLDKYPWTTLSAGMSYLALAVIICPRTPAPFWVKLCSCIITGVLIL